MEMGRRAGSDGKSERARAPLTFPVPSIPRALPLIPLPSLQTTSLLGRQGRGEIHIDVKKDFYFTPHGKI